MESTNQSLLTLNPGTGAHVFGFITLDIITTLESEETMLVPGKMQWIRESRNALNTNGELAFGLEQLNDFIKCVSHVSKICVEGDPARLEKVLIRYPKLFASAAELSDYYTTMAQSFFIQLQHSYDQQPELMAAIMEGVVW